MENIEIGNTVILTNGRVFIIDGIDDHYFWGTDSDGDELWFCDEQIDVVLN